MPKKSKNFSKGFNVKDYNEFAGDIKVHPEAVIGEDSSIGEGTTIHNCILGKVTIGKNCIVGNYTILEDGVTIKDGAKVWHHNHLRKDSVIGEDCVIGDYIFIDVGVKLGKEVKIQNGVLIYHGVTVGDGVFFGPNCLTTNDLWPRARKPGGGLRGEEDWTVGTVTIKDDASIGAGAVLVANNITIGKAAMIGSGAVVIKDVPDYSVVVGNPSKVTGKVKDKEEYKSK